MRQGLLIMAASVCLSATAWAQETPAQADRREIEIAGQVFGKLETECPGRATEIRRGAANAINALPELKQRGMAIPLDATASRYTFGAAFLTAASGASGDALRRVTGAAIAGGIAGLGDPETTYLSGDQFSAMQLSGYAIGVDVSQVAGVTTIKRVVAHAPAERAGLQTGDEIIAIDGADITSLSLEEIVARLRASAATRVTVAVRRAGVTAPLTFAMERAVIVDPGVVATRDGDIGVVRIRSFTETASAEVGATLRAWAGQRVKAVVLDLRGNAGGLWSEVISTADLFVDDGPIASVGPASPCGSGDVDRYMAQAGVDWPGPLAVLIDRDTGSGAEVFAALLADRRGARLIGETSAGRGVIQSIIPIYGSRGGALKLHTGELLLSDGRPLNGNGLRPAIITTPTDNAMTQAVALLRAAPRP